MSLSLEELKTYMQNWDPETRAMLLERMERGYHREVLEKIRPHEAEILQAVLDRLIPQTEHEKIDLVSFLDWAIGKPLGRGDREEGLPPEEELFRRGVNGIEESSMGMYSHSFVGLRKDEMDEVLTAIQEGRAPGNTWKEIPQVKFFKRILSKALIGYCAHPFVWMRMGFPGPSFPEGYIWIEEKEVLQRKKHFRGWKNF